MTDFFTLLCNVFNDSCTLLGTSKYRTRITSDVSPGGIRPLSSNYKTLRKGEYINFNVMKGHIGMQAIDVTGICGGPLMCNVVPVRTRFSESIYGAQTKKTFIA
eukprot:gene17327-23635_t